MPLLWLLLVFLVACGEAEPSPPGMVSAGSPSQGTEGRQGADSQPPGNPRDCVVDFEPGRDYFPERARLRHAEQVTVEYGSHWKRLTLHRPWAGAERDARYLLLLCGTPPPEGYDDHVVIEIPARRVVTTSTTELPHLVELDLVDRLVGHDTVDWVYSPEVRRRLDSGAVAEVGSAPHLDIERLLALEPDLVLADSLGDPEQGLLPRLRQLGVPVVPMPSFLEKTPLGRAEWLVVTSLFFNREQRAERFFTQIEQRYLELRETVRRGLRDGRSRPLVLTSGPTEDIWWVPGGRSFVAQLLEDAGTRYPWAGEATPGSLPLSLESVLERARDAELWIHPGRFGSLAELLAVEPRLIHFRAFAEGRVYNNDARTTAEGGSDYWESGSSRPDRVLADLVEIAHPDLLEHELIYHRRLPAEPTP